MDQQTLDALTAWIDAYADATDDTLADLVAAVLLAYEGVDFYSARQVAAAAAEAADQSNLATVIAAGIAAQYVASTTGIIAETPVPAPPPTLLLIRGGVDMTDVYARPAKMVRRLVSRGLPRDQAWQRAAAYLASLADGDIRLAQRQALVDTMSDLGVTGYRRVVRPELSRTGSCGLCIAASDRVYKVSPRADRRARPSGATAFPLMPIHARCKCTVLPIVGEVDPGSTLNNLSLADLYADADGTTRELLKKVRYEVNEHGEWGPVLTRAGDNFTGPQDLRPAA